MRLLVLAGLLLFADAKPKSKPDVGLSYNYKPPATSYGIPSGLLNFNSVSSTPAPLLSPDSATVSPSFVPSTPSPISYVSSTPPSVSYATSTLSPISFSTTPASNFHLPLHEFNSFNGGIQSLANIPLDGGSLSGSLLGNAGLQDGNIHLGPSVANVYTGAGINGFSNIGDVALNVPQVNLGNVAQTEEVQNIGDSDDIGDHQVEVSKHLYFYSSPEDIQQPRQRVLLPTAPPKRNVRILFIKAPALITPPPVSIPAQQQNEEKTLVYVLVKKPEELAPIEINTPSPTAPSKPEVFFIKYKNQKEAEEAVENIQKQHKVDSTDSNVRGLVSNGLRFSQNVQVQAPLSGLGLNNQGVSISNKGALGAAYQGFTTPSIPLDINGFTTTISPLSVSGIVNSGSPVAGLSSVSFGNPPAYNGLNLNSGFQLNNLNQIPSQFSLQAFSNQNVNPPSFGIQNTEVFGRAGLNNIEPTSTPAVLSQGGNVGTSSVEINKENPQSIDNTKALSESFGGPESQSESSNSIIISTSKPKSPKVDTDSNIVPQSVYGVPSKRGILFKRKWH